MSKIALVAIGRRENLYAVEFVEHYKSLGFDNIFILDNNHDGEEHFEDVLSPFVDSGFVKIIDYRNQIKPQMRAYTRFTLKLVRTTTGLPSMTSMSSCSSTE